MAIQIKGTNIGTVSDKDGRYCISPITSNETLIFSHIGFKIQEVLTETIPESCPNEYCVWELNIALECEDNI